jgi:hypothetical protein
LGLLDKHGAGVQDIFRAMYEVINYPAEYVKKKPLEKAPSCELKPKRKQPVTIDDNEACAS